MGNDTKEIFFTFTDGKWRPECPDCAVDCKAILRLGSIYIYCPLCLKAWRP